MGIFARIVELENNEQCLLVRKYNEEDERECVIITHDFDGVRVDLTLNFKNKEGAEDFFINETKENFEKQKQGLIEKLGL